MDLFLTSLLGGMEHGFFGGRVPSPILSCNGLADNIKKVWPYEARVAVLCADPDDHNKNDSIISCFYESLPMSGLPFSSIFMIDGRNGKDVSAIKDTDVIILTGGHVPTQNEFFRKIGLRERLKDHKGLILAWSAGSMNCADMVYAGPELPGEAVDPSYERWLKGLELTKINIYPHFQTLRYEMLDGLRILEDITFDDSAGHEIIALNDGSYIMADDKGSVIYGEAYRILDKRLELICSDGGSLRLG